MITGLPSCGGTCHTRTATPSAAVSGTSCASGSPAAAGVVWIVSGKYISERCAKYIIAASADVAANAMTASQPNTAIVRDHFVRRHLWATRGAARAESSRRRAAARARPMSSLSAWSHGEAETGGVVYAYSVVEHERKLTAYTKQTGRLFLSRPAEFRAPPRDRQPWRATTDLLTDRPARSATGNRSLRSRPYACPNSNRAQAEHSRDRAADSTQPAAAADSGGGG